MTSSNTQQLKELNEKHQIELTYQVGTKDEVRATPNNKDLDKLKDEIKKLAEKYAGQTNKLKVRIIIEEPR